MNAEEKEKHRPQRAKDFHNLWSCQECTELMHVDANGEPLGCVEVLHAEVQELDATLQRLAEANHRVGEALIQARAEVQSLALYKAALKELVNAFDKGVSFDPWGARVEALSAARDLVAKETASPAQEK